MSLALFDLDNTLLGGDSDYEWGRFLAEQGVVDPEDYARENRRFFQQYEAGNLDIYEYARFAYRPLAEIPLQRLRQIRQDFLEQRIRPLILPKALTLLRRHRLRGDTRVIITSTNRFITEPIAQLLEVDDLIATDPEFRGGRYTGELAGIPCFQEGKIQRLQGWLRKHRETLDGSWFYSDSHNDIPLLETVSHPVAVDPDARLAAHARARGWPALSLRKHGAVASQY
jgi:HAD superfamily hydrolase (TIGR01490 family)